MSNFLPPPVCQGPAAARDGHGVPETGQGSRNHAALCLPRHAAVDARLAPIQRHQYKGPRDRLDLWDAIMLNFFTSARVGEYIESAAREGTGRGLYYKDVEFVVFRNEYGETEFGTKVTKDAKGMTATPW